ncbi:MAG: hypothetical protein R2800_08105 [Flavipsychrobacter sp.]
MADVTEIIHKITYETETSSIEKANVVIQQQLKELKQLNEAVASLNQKVKAAGDAEAESFKKVTKELDGLNKKLEKLSAKTKGALSEVGKGVKAGLGLGKGIAGVAEKATEMLINLVDESIKLAQEVDAVKGSFDALGEPDLLSGLREAVQGTVSDLELMKQAVSYSNIGVPVEELASVLGFATQKANTTGKSVDELVRGIVDGIGNSSVIALRDLGVDVQKLNEEFAKTGDFAEAAYNVIQQQSEAAGSAILTVSQKQAQVAAQMQNQQAEIGKTFNELGGYVKSFLADLVSEGDLTITKSYHKNLKAAEQLAKDQAQAQIDANDIFLNNFEQFTKDYAHQDYKGREDIIAQADAMHQQLREDALTHFQGSKKELDIYLSGLELAYERTKKNLAGQKIDLSTITVDSVKGLSIEQLNDLQSQIKSKDNTRTRNSEENEKLNNLLIAIRKERDIIFGNDKRTTTTSSKPKPKPQPKPKDLNIKLEPTFDPDEAQRTSEEITRIEAQKNAIKLRSQIPDRIQRVDDKEQKELLANERAYKAGLRTLEAYEEEKTKITQKYVLERLDAEIAANQEILNLQGLSVEQKEIAERELTKATVKRLEITNKQKAADKQAADNANNDEKQKGLTDAQKENIKNGIDAYQQLAQAAADAYNTIIQAQIDALDKEISVRERRVEAAKKLAERGNTEALKLEEDRLRKAEAKRAQFAKRQQAINAAITVSNAIAAVARAALEGGGFGSIATIAALIAALAAGYAAVTSMSQDGGGDAFADGVVGYQGKGGPRDDKNWVRISTGESVITAEGTQRNRALLEAINNGVAFSTINPAAMPLLKQPKSPHQGQHYATAKELNGLEKKLDDVVYAIEGNKLKQNIFFDEQGVGIMTERAINKNRKRWK